MSLSVQSGRAIQHVKENIFTAEGGVRRGIPNVLVVLTDGRSQDDVNKVSKEMQMEGQGRVVCGFKKSPTDQVWISGFLPVWFALIDFSLKIMTSIERNSKKFNLRFLIFTLNFHINLDIFVLYLLHIC